MRILVIEDDHKIAGAIAGIIFSNPILNALVASSIGAARTGRIGQGQIRFGELAGQFGGQLQVTVRGLHASACQ